MKNNKKGFTLIELLVVIAIIGLLSTLAVVSLNGARTKARDARRMSDMKQISTAMELYSSDNATSNYPTNRVAPALCGSVGAVAEVEDGGAIDDLCGSGFAITDGPNTYLASIPIDPTNYEDNTTPINEYKYHYEGDNDNYCISAHLENATVGTDDYFVCLNGSCFKRGSDCTEAGL